MDFVAIDFETANNNLNSACSVGLVVVKDLEIIRKEYFLIKPPTDHFQKENIQIHNITYDDVKNCDDFKCIWENIKSYFNEVVIAHNAQFDMSVLKNLFDTYDIISPDFVYLDSINISNSVCSCGNSLVDRANELNIELNNHHNSLDDAITCANIAIESIKKFNVSSFMQFILRYENLTAKEFSKINANKTFKGRAKIPGYANVKISDISAITSKFDNNHPFYNKNIVLTGELSMYERKEAMQLIIDSGGVLKSGVSKVTDYLIVGRQDIKLVGEDGLSSKEEKAYELINKGFNIKIIYEDEFINLISEKSYI